MRTKTLCAPILSLLLLAAFAPTAEATDADCSSDPCVHSYCTVGHASAHAYGSEYAWADASAGGWAAHDEGVGHQEANAYSTGSTAVSASGLAKKDWSLDEDSNSCNGPGGFILDPALGFLEVPAAYHGIGVGCVTDDRITKTGGFDALLYAGDDGFVAYDAARGVGLALASLEMRFDGTTLDRLVPLDVTGMEPLGVAVTLDIVFGGEKGGNHCGTSFSFV